MKRKSSTRLIYWINIHFLCCAADEKTCFNDGIVENATLSAALCKSFDSGIRLNSIIAWNIWLKGQNYISPGQIYNCIIFGRLMFI